jgi:REP element-mobilizing transposase RayT
MDASRKRKSLRLSGYDYSRAGAYFVSICTKDQKCLFGEIVNQEIVLNEPGRMITTGWNELAQRFSRIELIEHVIMPNHIHGIIAIVGVPLVGTRKPIGDSSNRADTRPAPTAGLGDIVGAFKSITTHEYIRGVRQYEWTPFPGKLWQRNYYEHVVRNEKELTRIREYIRNNPAKWDTDKDNPFTQDFDKHSHTIKEQ